MMGGNGAPRASTVPAGTGIRRFDDNDNLSHHHIQPQSIHQPPAVVLYVYRYSVQPATSRSVYSNVIISHYKVKWQVASGKWQVASGIILHLQKYNFSRACPLDCLLASINKNLTAM